MMASIIWFIIILSVIVIAHEFGHFIVARMNGIRVLEFDVGFGPTLLHFTKKGTKFALKALPFGGACIFDSDVALEPHKDAELKADEDELLEKPAGIPFREAKVWARISAVFAGPFFNFILAMIFSMIIVANCGSDLPTISNLTEGRPAIESGLQVGDTITAINGEKIHIWRDITLISILNRGEELTIEYERNGEKGKVSFAPQYSEADGRYYIGIEGGNNIVECKGWNLFKYSWYELGFNFKNTLKSLRELVLGRLSKDDVAGPVGVAQIVGESYNSVKQYGFSSIVLTMMNLAMLLSVNLGVLNLLPLPALDGGRLVFLFIEVVRGKPVPADKEGIVHLIGIILFFALTVFILFNDIMRFFR
ncbi:MAG: RIP metalloprotease RseP [Lachnospiraceae bacterium]|nr:RIP metalloprotease RseP [Lachnospiraceae bacterium]MBO4824997.1 RIP metalloprotease RseP [Lachnospiraceae bacterium]MBR5993245.1 RIP metalloprotease RseP [Lachnospiraceae bacterium]